MDGTSKEELVERLNTVFPPDAISLLEKFIKEIAGSGGGGEQPVGDFLPLSGNSIEVNPLRKLAISNIDYADVVAGNPLPPSYGMLTVDTGSDEGHINSASFIYAETAGEVKQGITQFGSGSFYGSYTTQNSYMNQNHMASMSVNSGDKRFTLITTSSSDSGSVSSEVEGRDGKISLRVSNTQISGSNTTYTISNEGIEASEVIEPKSSKSFVQQAFTDRFVNLYQAESIAGYESYSFDNPENNAPIYRTLIRFQDVSAYGPIVNLPDVNEIISISCVVEIDGKKYLPNHVDKIGSIYYHYNQLTFDSNTKDLILECFTRDDAWAKSPMVLGGGEDVIKAVICIEYNKVIPPN